MSDMHWTSRRCRERPSLCRLDIPLLLVMIIYDVENDDDNRVMFAKLSGDVQ